MLNEKLFDMFSKQINLELYSAYLYKEFANYYDSINLNGFGHWYHVQSMEEIKHGSKMIEYVINQGRKPDLKDIPKPEIKIKGLSDIAKKGLKHEMFITQQINAIYSTAEDLKDYKTQEFLNWFIKEQDEEEINACNMKSLIEKIEGNKAALFFADLKMSERKD